MPTGPKLVAAVFFAALGWFCADLVKPLLPEGTRVGWLNITVAALGAISGWLMSGARAGDGLSSGFGLGLTSSALTAFWSVFLFGGQEMLDLSLKKRFHGPVEALQGMVGLIIDNIFLIGTPTIIGTLIVGGLFGGWLTEWAAKRWS